MWLTVRRLVDLLKNNDFRLECVPKGWEGKGGGGGGSESVELLAWLAVGTDSTHYIGCAR